MSTVATSAAKPNPGVSILLKHEGSPTGGALAASLSVIGLPLLPSEMELKGMRVRVLDQSRRTPGALVHENGHQQAGAAVYDLLAVPCRLPACLAVKIDIHASTIALTNIEGASGGLSFGLALAEHIICTCPGPYRYQRPNFGYVAATGTLDRWGNVGPVDYLNEKIEAYLQRLNELEYGEEPAQFTVFLPAANAHQVRAELTASVTRRGGTLVPVSTLKHALHCLGVELPDHSQDITLQSYSMVDAWRYSGRSGLKRRSLKKIHTLAQANAAQQSAAPVVLFIDGRSGSGKSSFLQAGLMAYFNLPAAANDFLPVTHFLMAEEPFRPAQCGGNLISGLARHIASVCAFAALDHEYLAQLMSSSPALAHQEIETALLEARPHTISVIILFIDQWEEVFHDNVSLEERLRFHAALIQLCRHANSRVWVIGAFRSDYRQDMLDSGWADILKHEAHQEWISSPSARELEEIIVNAIENTPDELGFESPLVASQIALDARSLDGQLAPLSLALHQMKNLAREHGQTRISSEMYDQFGGMAGIIAQHANDSFYQQLNEAQKVIFDQLMHSFIGIAPQQKKAYAKTVSAAELPKDLAYQDIVDRLLNARLLVEYGEGDSRKLRLVHETLLTHWDILKQWHVREQNRIHGEAIASARHVAEKERRARWRLMFLCVLLLLFVAISVQQWQRAEREKSEALQSQNHFLIEMASQQAKKGFYDTALLLWLHAMPGPYGGERPAPTLDGRFYRALAKQHKVAEFRHTAPVTVVAYDPKGKHYLTADKNGTAIVWSAATNTPVKKLQHDKAINSAHFSPDGMSILTASDDHHACIWPLNHQEPHICFAHNAAIRSAVYNRVGNQVLTGSLDFTAKLWAVDRSEPLQVFQHKGPLQAALFNNDDQQVLTAAWDGFATLWDTHTGQPLQVFKHEAFNVNDVMPGVTNDTLVSAAENVVTIWDAHSGQPLHRLEHSYTVTAMCWLNDHSRLATISWDGKLRLWSPEGELLNTVDAGDSLYSLALSADGTRLATAGRLGDVRLWDAKALQPLGRYRHHDEVLQVSFSPSATTLLSASKDHTAALWQYRPHYRQWSFDAGGPLTQIALDTGRRRLATTGWSGRSQLWALDQGLAIGHIAHGSKGTSLQLSADGRWWIASADDKLVTLKDTLNGDNFFTFEVSSPVQHASISENGQWLLIEAGRQVVLYSIEQRRAINQWAFEHPVVGALFSQAQDQVAVLLKNGEIHSALLLGASQRTALTLTTVISVTRSKRDRAVAVVTHDNKVALWSSKDLTQVQWLTVAPYGSSSLQLAFNNNDTLLAMMTSSDKVEIWNVSESEKFSSTHILMPKTSMQVTALALSDDGKSLAWGDTDGRIDVQHLDSDTLIATFYQTTSIAHLTFGKDYLVSGAHDGRVAVWQWPSALRWNSMEQARLALPKNHVCLSPQEREAFFLRGIAASLCEDGAFAK